MLYPLIGFMADSSCGCFISSFCLLLFSYLTAYICVVVKLILIKYYYDTCMPSAIWVIALLVIFISLGRYRTNFIQLGLDQQLSALSKDLALFVHWVMWAYNFGCTIMVTTFKPFLCSTVNTTWRIVIVAIPLILIFFPSGFNCQLFEAKPSRLDFGKETFGVPFTTEQVEDTKSFFKVVSL